MTGAASTARVWLSVIGVVVGILLARAGIPGHVALLGGAAGIGLLLTRRRAPLALLGILLATSGISVLRAALPAGASSWDVPAATAYRSALTGTLRSAPERPGALLGGLTIGVTSGVDEDTTENFRRSGLAHLVAVSGSNVAMVLAAIAIVTVRLPLSLRGGLAIAAVGMYVAVVGPEPSVLRAAAMGTVGVIGYVAGRETVSLNSLGIALIAVLGSRPELLFAVGLHLSAAATLGIVVWSRPIEQRLRVLPALLRAPIAITLSAQIAVAPLLIVVFEQVSLVAPLANVLAAPAVPPATVIGLSAGAAGLVSMTIGGLLAATAAPFAQWILWVADETARWSWASVEVPAAWGWALGAPVAAAAVAGAVLRSGR